MQNKNMYYGKEGEPIPFEAWVELWQAGDRSVARTVVCDGAAVVCTSWLGIEGMVYETLVQGVDGDEATLRADNMQDALQNHLAAVREAVNDYWNKNKEVQA